MISSPLTGLSAVGLLLFASHLQALEFDVRAKLFAVGTALPSHSLQRQLVGTPSYDYNGDLRLMFRQDFGGFSLKVDQATLVTGGDSFAFFANPGADLDQSPTDDRFRLMDLTWEIASGSKYRVVHRLDRLALQYRGSSWGFTLGREAVSWGSGVIFQPMDLFSPFAPTTVDRDYKAGDDLLIIDKLFQDGSDLQLLGVARRNLEGQASASVASAAVKWHTFVGAGELELFAGKHYSDQVYGGSVRVPLGGAMLRTDLVTTRLEGGDWRLSGIVNMDTSFSTLGKPTYAFAEYYHNAFGVKKLPQSVLQLPLPLVERLGRGEVFNLMRDYLALGGSIEWHALWNQTLTLIGNLRDGSSLLLAQVSYTQSDHATVELGVVAAIGKAGQEFGGVPVFGKTATSGGAIQGYLRWAYYF